MHYKFPNEEIKKNSMFFRLFVDIQAKSILDTLLSILKKRLIFGNIRFFIDYGITITFCSIYDQLSQTYNYDTIPMSKIQSSLEIK